MAHLEFEKPLVELEDRIRELKVSGVRETGFEGEIRRLEERVERLQREIYDQLAVWQKVQLSRHPDRPYFLDYVERIFEDVLELHGDRCYRRRSGDRRRLRAARGPHGGHRRAPEGAHHQGESFAATSGWPIRRGTGKPCASWSWPIASGGPS